MAGHNFVVCRDRIASTIIVSTVVVSSHAQKGMLSYSKDFLSLPTVYVRKSEFQFKDPLNLTGNWQVGNITLCEPFYKALPNFKPINLPRVLTGMNEIPKGNLIEKLQNLDSVQVDDNSYFGEYVRLAAVIVLATLAVGIFIYVKWLANETGSDRMTGNSGATVPGMARVSVQPDGEVPALGDEVNSEPLLRDGATVEGAAVPRVGEASRLYPSLDQSWCQRR